MAQGVESDGGVKTDLGMPNVVVKATAWLLMDERAKSSDRVACMV